MPHRPFFFLTALLLFLGLLPLAAYTQPPPQEVLLQNVNALTLYRHRHTAGRRSSGIPQLQCVGGNACDVHTPEVVQCTNTGFDGRDVQWKCEADLPTEFRFGPLEVSCEGFEYPDDPYVLAGSCGLEYTLYYREGRNDRTGRDFYDDQSMANPKYLRNPTHLYNPYHLCRPRLWPLLCHIPYLHGPLLLQPNPELPTFR
ncbi:hypothetical protein BC938DRAFT_476912 [Jimgerdemannia flammicorona]|uniref:Store-operated calcium entry-associated regulatory factor n=1 Tax=Jimgerdemannia flammicorona TaxID=994334 RepID=A0A433PDB7_9FUNG|nr:hypothetical protein BC938DRAFT_476912 [Jimgerdemannia flammicorona]